MAWITEPPEVNTSSTIATRAPLEKRALDALLHPVPFGLLAHDEGVELLSGAVRLIQQRPQKRIGPHRQAADQLHPAYDRIDHARGQNIPSPESVVSLQSCSNRSFAAGSVTRFQISDRFFTTSSNCFLS